MDLDEYIIQQELNKNDPDYQIEDFWYGLKNSMCNFYRSIGKTNANIKLRSDKLNQLKTEKKYELIEENIKQYISFYAIDIMKLEKTNVNTHSQILITNIRRWNKISNKFHFGYSEKNKKVYALFEAFYNIKKKFNSEFTHILELFKNIDQLLLDNLKTLSYLAFKNGFIRVLEIIENIIGYEILLDYIKKDFELVTISSVDKNTRWDKLYKRYLIATNL